MAFDHGYALLIGVGSYTHAPHMNAPLTVEDAKEIQAVLQDPTRAGYPAEQVTMLNEEGATRQAVLDALDALADRSAASDTVFLFYAGHGDFDNAGKYYLTTHDTRWEHGGVVPGTGVREDELLQKLNAIEARRAFLLFNSCHSGAIGPTQLGQLGGNGGAPEAGQPLPDETSSALLATGEGRVVITACRQDQRSYFIPSDALTFFADALSNGLQGKRVPNRKGYITVFDLYLSVYEDVTAEIERRSKGKFTQEPELTVLRGIGAMAIALHRGREGVGSLGPDDRPQALPAATREVEPSESEAYLQQILSGTIQHSLVAGRDARQAGRDLVEGNQVTIDNSPGAIGEVSGGTVSQQFGDNIDTGGGTFIGDGVQMGDGGTFVGRDQHVGGDLVQGDKTGGDKITVGDISGSSGIAIGHGAHASVLHGGSPTDVDALFETIYERIERSTHDDAMQPVIRQQVELIQQEATKGQNADETRVEKAFRVLKNVAPDILQVAAAALANPVAGISKGVQKVAERMRAQRGGAS